MIITKRGVAIRMNVDSIRTMGRAAQGVRLINLKKTAEIAAIARVPRSEDDEETMDSDELEGNDNNTETDSEA
jgi:DNA gyrase subunit A